MKKLLSILLCGLMILELCSCNKNEDNPNNIEPINSDNSNNSENLDNVLNNEDDFYYYGEILPVYLEDKYNETDIMVKFLGTMIVNVRPDEYKDFDIPIISSEDDNYNLMFSLLHLNKDYIEEFAISASSNPTRAYTVAILKVVPFYEEVVLDSLSQRISDLRNQVKNYPDQLYIVENSIIVSFGDYIGCVICDNAKDVCDMFEECMIKQDLTVLKPIPVMSEEEVLQIENDSLNKEIEGIKSQLDELNLQEINEN